MALLDLKFIGRVVTSPALVNVLPPAKLGKLISEAESEHQQRIKAYYEHADENTPLYSNKMHDTIITRIVDGSECKFVLISQLTGMSEDEDGVQALRFKTYAFTLDEYAAAILNLAALINQLKRQKPSGKG